MEENLKEAIALYKKGEKVQASKLLSEIVQRDPNNATAWYGLALCLTDTDKRIYCLQKTIALDPSNQKAKQLLDKLQSSKNLQSHSPSLLSKVSQPSSNKKPLSINWSTVITFGVIGVSIIIVLLLNRKGPYQPTAYDAFSNATGYVLSEMYARAPVNYYCEETETKKASYWYQIQVSDLGNGKYNVVGATKAMDQYCVYETGYFATTVRYDSQNELWNLEGEIYFSNSCLTVKSDSGDCTNWKYDWQPDMNWRPPK